MQGRDSFTESNVSSPDISLSDHETNADLQSPKFYTPEYLHDEANNEALYDSESSTQLEDLQHLLEMAHQNEETSQQRFAKMAKTLESVEDDLEATKLQLDISTAQDKLTIENLQTTINELTSVRDAAVKFAENLVKQRDEALVKQKEEKLNNAKLHLRLKDVEQRSAQIETSYEKKQDELYIQLETQRNESSKFKKVILKQSNMLSVKDTEVAQLKAQLALHTQAAQFGRQTFFRDARIPAVEPEKFILGSHKTRK